MRGTKGDSPTAYANTLLNCVVETLGHEYGIVALTTLSNMSTDGGTSASISANSK